MGVVEERAVAVDAGVSPFMEDSSARLQVEVAMERDSLAVLDTVDGPKLLPQAVQVNDVARILAVVLACKAAMTGGMPVLCRYHETEKRRKPIGDLHNGVAIRNGQRSARHEIVLQINNDQCLHRNRRSVLVGGLGADFPPAEWTPRSFTR